MTLKQVTQEIYFDQCNKIITNIMDSLLIVKTQIGLIKSIKDTNLRKQLIDNEKDLCKILKELNTNFVKHSKTTIKKDLSPNMKSGFAKPLPISNELSEFTGWDVNEMKSRNDITRYICDYIKNNNLA